MEKNNILFVCSAGPQVGFGHFTRTMSIFNFFIEKGFDSKLIVLGKNINDIDKKFKKFNDLNGIKKYIINNNFKNIFFDLSKKNIDKSLVKFLKKKQKKYNFFGLDQIYILHKFFKLVFIPNPVIPIKKKNIFGGIKYCFLNQKKLTNYNKDNKISIILGSNKSYKYLYKILKNLNKFDSKYKINLILGKYTKSFSSIQDRFLNKNIKIFHHLGSISKFIKNSKFLICNYGTTLFEILRENKICLLIDDLDKENKKGTIYLQEKKYCYLTNINDMTKNMNYMIKNKNILIKKNLKKLNKINSLQLIYDKIFKIIKQND